MNKAVYGPTVGSHLGKPIFATIEREGVKYNFDRMAECDSEGCHLQQLVNDEVMLPAGLIYKKAA